MRSWTARILFLTAVPFAASSCGDDDGGGPSVSLDPDSGPPGTEIAVEASGCENLSGGNLVVGDGSDQIAEVDFDAAGTGTVTVPDDAEPGDYRVVVICRSEPQESEGGLTETLEDAEATFEVTG